MIFKIFTILLTLTGLGVSSAAQKTPVKLSTEADIKADFKLVPCADRRARREAVKKLFLKMGAAESEIVFEKLDDVVNVVVTQKGKTAETVIVGAHFDKADEGCGAIDNWSGIVILAHLYRTMKQFTTQKTYKFVAFDKEELGLLGSAAMAKEIPKEKRAEYCAMVNFDSFGLSYPQAQRNISSDSLVELAKEVSESMKMPFSKAAIAFARSDSESFRTRDIPAIGFHGLNDQWKDYLHTWKDIIDNANPESVYFGYRHGLVFLSSIENKPCDAFRKVKKQ